MQELIFHHYWQSPVAEKVRVALGFLGASWRSVEIPRIPPKPDLVLLTGGYRRTPVLQIGADIYCDSHCILQKLDRCFPQKALVATDQLLPAMGFANWANNELFSHAVRIVLGHDVQSLPREFLQDRARLYFGPDWTEDSISAGVAHSVSQIQVLLHWLQSALASGQPFLTGEQPALHDALCYYVIWFLRGRYAGGPELLERFAGVAEWEARVQGYGHGQHKDLDSSDAIRIAREATPDPVGSSHAGAAGIGEQVGVTPAGDGGDPQVRGILVQLTHEQIVLARESDETGLLHIHFPRTGYMLS